MSRYSAVLISLVLGLGLTAGSAAASPAPGGNQLRSANASSSSYCADAEAQKFLSLINSYRRSNGLAPLALSQTLGAAAQHHSASMAGNDYFSHDLIPEGITWSKNLDNYGYTYTTYRGENIAAGSSTASGTISQWKASSTHKATMLSSRYKAIGIGRAYDANSQYGWYWTTDFGGKADLTGKLC
jgi:uncharacterized protein YkwD